MELFVELYCFNHFKDYPHLSEIQMNPKQLCPPAMLVGISGNLSPNTSVGGKDVYAVSIFLSPFFILEILNKNSYIILMQYQQLMIMRQGVHNLKLQATYSHPNLAYSLEGSPDTLSEL